MFGKSLWDNSPLERSALRDIYNRITTGSHGLEKQIYNLRTILTISEGNYQQAKRELPFFTLAVFHPAIRKKENFAAAYGMVIDIDKLDISPAQFNAIRERIRDQSTTAMEFVSPSQNGIKVIIKFTEPIKDAVLYSNFYKSFLHQWAKKTNLQDYVDYKTSDASRITFLSYDPSAYFNPEAEKLNPNKLFGQEEFPFHSETKSRQKKTEGSTTSLDQAQISEAENINSGTNSNETDASSQDLRAETLLAIRQRLRKKDPPKKIHHDPNIYVPDEVNSSLPKIEKELANFNVKLIESRPIQYGRKVKVGIPGAWAVVNVFYGAKGFSVVATPMRGSDSELATLTKDVLLSIL